MLSVYNSVNPNVAVTINEKESTVNGQNKHIHVEYCVLSRIVPACWCDHVIAPANNLPISAIRAQRLFSYKVGTQAPPGINPEVSVPLQAPAAAADGRPREPSQGGLMPGAAMLTGYR
jgi:hypothetical protein